MERQRAFQYFCERVHQEASQVEQYVVRQLDRYGEYLNMPGEFEDDNLLKRYQVNMRSIMAQLEILKTQIPGIIRNEVSARLSDNNSECMRIRRMLPGAEKEAQMNQYLESIISDAVDKCAKTTESIMKQMQNIFVDDLRRCVDFSRKHLEDIERSLSGLTEAEDEVAERVRIRTNAEHIFRCSDLISGLFEQEG